MEVLELKAVREEDGGPKPRKREQQARETQTSERATSTEPRSCRGERVTHCLITLTDICTARCHENKLPFVLCTRKVKPSRGKNTVIPSKPTERVHDGMKWL